MRLNMHLCIGSICAWHGRSAGACCIVNIKDVVDQTQSPALTDGSHRTLMQPLLQHLQDTSITITHFNMHLKHVYVRCRMSGSHARCTGQM
jgi:hypothetical protein